MVSFAIQPTKPVKKLQFEIEETPNGQWRTYYHTDGKKFTEYRSDAEMFGLPLVSIVSGVHPETRALGTAHGVVAIGQKARGVIAIGQFCDGYISIGQFGFGRVAAIGQFTVAPISVGQFTLALAGIAQFGMAAVGIFQMGAVFAGGWGQAVFNFSQFLANIL